MCARASDLGVLVYSLGMKIRLEAIREVFVLYCALNANGYDKENGPAMHPVRERVRAFLKGKQLEKFDFKWNPYQYTKQVLTSVGWEPTKEANPDFLESLSYLKRFEQEANLDSIWEEVKAKTETVLDDYRREVTRIVGELDRWLKMEEPAGEVIISVNLLEAYFRGFSIPAGDKTYVILGPSLQPNLRNFLHELLHAYLRKLSYPRLAEKLYQQIPEDLKANYTIDKIGEESMARALVSYLGGRLKIDKTALSEQDKKLVFPELFLKELKKLAPEKITDEVIDQVVSTKFSV